MTYHTCRGQFKENDPLAFLKKSCGILGGPLCLSSVKCPTNWEPFLCRATGVGDKVNCLFVQMLCLEQEKYHIFLYFRQQKVLSHLCWLSEFAFTRWGLLWYLYTLCFIALKWTVYTLMLLVCGRQCSYETYQAPSQGSCTNLEFKSDFRDPG